MRVPISFIIPTRNEERNLPKAINSIEAWADEIFVLDSYSDDRTVDIAKKMGAQVAQRNFDNFSAQKNWGLDNLPFRNEWVFLLDADERLTSGLRQEIEYSISTSAKPFDGYYVGRKIYFAGAWIRHGGFYPNWNLRLFKHKRGRYESRLVHEHIILDGRVGYLKEPMLHDDYKGIERYFDRHNVYSTMEALEVHRRTHHMGSNKQIVKASFVGKAAERRRAIKEWAYSYLPCRSLGKFIWCYAVRGGFLDGRIGFRFCLLQSFYEYQISLKLLELSADSMSPMLRYHSPQVAESTPEVFSGIVIGDTD